MDSWHVLAEILMLLSAALLFGTLAEQFRQSSIIGFLLAGALVGPKGLGWVHSGSPVEVIAELGVALLLFTIGLEFSVARLRKLGAAPLLGGVAQVIVTMTLVFAGARFFGLEGRAAFVLGAVFALSSTATVLRLLTDSSALERPYGRISLGILLVQDIAVFPLALLVSAMSREEGGSAGQMSWELLRTLLAAVAMIAAFLFLFNGLVPRLLNIRDWSRNREFPILLAVIMALGSAATAHAAGISPAIGAFLAGVLLGESVFAAQIRADVSSVKAVLVTFFFASIGLLFEPDWAFANLGHVLGVAGLLIVGKVLLVWLVLRPFGVRHEVALASGLCLAQVGEFAFVIAGIARGAIFDEDLVRLIVSVTIVTLLLAPLLVDQAPRLASAFAGLWPSEDRPPQGRPDSDRDGAAGRPLVIIGFGPASQMLLDKIAGDRTGPITVIDLNPRAAEAVARYGADLHIGQAGHRDVLEEAGVKSALAVVVTIPDPVTAVDVIQQCRRLAPETPILARARYHIYRGELEAAGADVVVDEEVSVGHGLAVALRPLLGSREERP